MCALPVRKVTMPGTFALRSFTSRATTVILNESVHTRAFLLHLVLSVNALLHWHTLLDVEPVPIAPGHQITGWAELQLLNGRPSDIYLDWFHLGAAFRTTVVQQRSINGW